MNEFELAKRDPSCIFSTPEDVLLHKSFTREQKIAVLRSWEYDARELQVAEEENMAGNDPDLLDKIHQALASLNADISDHPPTKQS